MERSRRVPIPLRGPVSPTRWHFRLSRSRIERLRRGSSRLSITHQRNILRFGPFVTAFFAASVSAQEAPGPISLPDLVVSASRTAVEAKEVGSAVTVISRQDIERRQARYVSDLLRSVPSLSVNRSGSFGGQTQVRIRGAEGNHTLVVIDGVEANDPISDSEYDFSNLLADDIERIEVLRGPQSAIWGSDSIGGVINIVTRRGFEGFQAHGSAEGGSFGTYRLNAGVRGGTKRLRGSLSGTVLHSDGVNIAGSGSEKDGYENGTFNATGDLEVTDNFTISLNGRYNRTDAQHDRQDFAVPATPTQGLVVDADDESEFEQIFGRSQGRLVLLDGAWEQVLGVGYTRTNRENYSNDRLTSETTGAKTKIDYQSSFFFSTPSVANAEHTLTFYAEREHEEFRNRSIDVPSANQNRDATEHGFVGEYRVDLWDQLFLSGAVRHDDNERFEDATTWRATAAWMVPGTGTRLHGSYATGVTNPTFFDLFGFDPGSFAGNPDLEPEKSDGWDIGLEQALFDERLVVDVTYFEADLRDEIITTFPAPNFVATPVNQDGKSKRRGVELTMNARVTDDIDLGGTFTWLDAKDPDGQREVRRPEFLASLRANYRFLDGRANVNLSADYNGRMRDNEFVFATPEDRVWLDEFVLVNLAASYRLTDRVQLFGRIENLLDEDYQEVYSFNTPGIGAYAGVRLTFGGP